MIYLLSVISFSGLTVALAAMLMIAERLLINYGICKLDINAGEKPLELEGGETLLAALYANGRVALGNDAGYLKGLEIGMPMREIEWMQKAGMTPMQIIVAATRNAAYVCNREGTLGTLEVGKFADVLVVDGDPLQHLEALTNVRLVIHRGVIINESAPR